MVINGESWGLYVNVQQFDKIFLAENLSEQQGRPLESPGQPRAAAAASIISATTSRNTSDGYEIKTGDKQAAWEGLIDCARPSTRRRWTGWKRR